MPIRAELSTKVSFRAHVFEVPLDIDGLEGMIREHTRKAVLDFLGDEVLAPEERELTVEVEVTMLSTTDPRDDVPVGVRKKDFTQ